MKTYLSYLRIVLKTQLEHRSGFIIMIVSQATIPLVACAGIAVLFGRFGRVGGWTAPEALLCFAVAHCAFSVATCIARGFDQFSTMVISGDFDRVLVRPVSTILQVLGSKFELTRLGRAAQAMIVLVWAVSALPAPLDALRVFVLISAILSGIVVFMGVYVLTASWCFLSVQGLELANILTDGGREISQYPLTIYQKNFVRFFTFVIPFAGFNYLPLSWVLSRPEGDMVMALVSPWLGMLFIVPCGLAWHVGVRRYRSTGS